MKAPLKYLVNDTNKKIKENLKTIAVKLGASHSIKFENIEVIYDLNSSRALGTYIFDRVTSKHTINLNPALLNELKQAYIDEVVTHELCHALVKHNHGADARRRIMPHGREFKWYASLLGIDGKSTTTVAKGSTTLATTNRKKFTYHCNCQEFQLSTQRHNKIISGTQSYSCKQCKSTIKHGKLQAKKEASLA